MRVGMRRMPLISFPVVVLIVAGCSPAEPPVVLPDTSVLVGRGSVALVRVDYGRIHEHPEISGDVLHHARFGDVLSVIGRTPEEDWVQVESPLGQGWMYRGDVELFATRAQAQNARERLERERSAQDEVGP